MQLEPGLRATVTHIVGHDDTAIALGSGGVPVLGTPRLVAWCEAATVAAIASALDAGTTSVGTNVNLDHRAPTRVGGEITVTAVLDGVDGRSVIFEVSATEGDAIIGSGTIRRAVVNTERFLA